MKLSTWQEPAAVIAGIVTVMGGISGTICTIKEANVFLGLCVLAAAVMAFPFIIGLYKKGQPRSEDE